MTLKLIDLFETKFIGGQNLDNKKKFENIEVHSIVNCDENIRKQFILVVSTYHNNLFVVNLFKKVFNKDKIWIKDRLQYISSLSLSLTCDNKYNWKSLEDETFIQKNILDDSYFILDESYNFSVLFEDYDFYINLKTKYNILDNDICDELSDKIWGRTYNSESIIWQVILNNLVTMLYGSAINEINFRCKNFTRTNMKNLYYPNYNEKSIIYKKFTKNKLGLCDNCEDNLDIYNNYVWNDPNYGDLCNSCFNEKKTREDYRKNYFKRYMLSLGKSSLFKSELERTLKFLEKHEIKELSNEKKYEILKNVNDEISKSSKKVYMQCCVCLEDMKENIYAGSCGHCLHDTCYFKLNSNQCPMCRKITNFKKLHL